MKKQDSIALQLISAHNIIKLNRHCIENQSEQIKGLQNYCKILMRKNESLETTRTKLIADKQKLLSNIRDHK